MRGLALTTSMRGVAGSRDAGVEWIRESESDEKG